MQLKKIATHYPELAKVLSVVEAIFKWNSCLLFSPKGDRENNCALQYASFVMNNLSVFLDVLVWIWSTHWNVVQ